jgi:hypothetical protein
MNLKEMAEYTGIPYSTVVRDWPTYKEKFGLNLSRRNGRPRAELIVKRTEVDAMIRQWQVV